MDAHESTEQQPAYRLSDGSRIAVIGGGPAGAFFSYFVLTMADRMGLELTIDIYEPKTFSDRGPSGCNMCGGIISESLVQTLATEGINLPSTVVQRGIEAYDMHTDVGSAKIRTPVNEKRIAAVHRGGGPKKSPATDWSSFDEYLLNLAERIGANVIKQPVTGLEWEKDRPVPVTKDGNRKKYDLAVVATGINTLSRKILATASSHYRPPRVTKTAIREFYLGQEAVSRSFGDSMHLFLMNIPRLKFAAMIPKGDCVTLCMLGQDIDRDLINLFLESPQASSLLPVETDDACACSPKMTLSAAERPFGNRLVFVGDCAVARLYKDGIGAAYRTAKAAARTAVFHGVSERDFADQYWPTCRSIVVDNHFGTVVFFVTGLIQKYLFAQRAVLDMVRREQHSSGPQRMSSVLWDSFTGSSSYRDIVWRTMHPGFLFGLARSFLKTFGHAQDSQDPVARKQEST